TSSEVECKLRRDHAGDEGRAGAGELPSAESAARRQLLRAQARTRSEEHTSELQSRGHLVCRLLLEKKKQEGKAQTSRPSPAEAVEGDKGNQGPRVAISPLVRAG